MTFLIKRGTNISHWLSQSNARGAERAKRFTRDDSKRLADLGLDHLRLPIDEEQMWSERGGREPEAWELLNKGLDWCEEDGMRAIVDLHILRSHYFNAEAGKNTLFSDPGAVERFADCWLDLSRELHTRSNDQVAYELLNEPVANDPEDWNRVLRAPYEAIRAEEARRIIAIGSNRFCSTSTFPDFNPPAGDPNIILVFHYYNPMLITHHSAPWWKTIGDYHGHVRYPGIPVSDKELQGLEPGLRSRIEAINKYFDIEVMKADIEPVLKKSAEMGLPAWCNEFGVFYKVDDDIRGAWYRDFLAALNENGIAWSNWDFRGGFGLFDKHNNPTVVVDALFG